MVLLFVFTDLHCHFLLRSYTSIAPHRPIKFLVPTRKCSEPEEVSVEQLRCFNPPILPYKCDEMTQSLFRNGNTLQSVELEIDCVE
jgi:hypothetical protein